MPQPCPFVWATSPQIGQCWSVKPAWSKLRCGHVNMHHAYLSIFIFPSLSSLLSSHSPPTLSDSGMDTKMCIRGYLNGDGMGYQSHLSIFFVIMRGECDPLLKWPFEHKVSMILVGKQSQPRLKQCDQSTMLVLIWYLAFFRDSCVEMALSSLPLMSGIPVLRWLCSVYH